MAQKKTLLVSIMLIYVSTASLLPEGYLSTDGNQIVDENGNPVRIAGIGWSGGDGSGNAPQGLMNAPLDQMMSQIVSLGFNAIRIPYNDAGYFEGGQTYIQNSNYNPELVGLSPFQVLDVIVSAAGNVSLKIIIDHHTNEGGANGWGGQQANGLWYDQGPGCDGTDGSGHQGTVTQQGFLNNWVAIASRYAGNPTVIGFDLHNEPLNYGEGQNPQVSWGDGAINDIYAMYTSVGNAIQSVNPDVLIICQGFITTDPAVDGFDLRGVAKYPVSLNISNKVVYSAHSYPSAIGGQPYDNGPEFYNQLNIAWGYLIINNTAPMWIGEIGASLDGTADSSGGGALQDEQNWAAAMIAYLGGSAQGGPSFSGNEEGISTSWWLWGCMPGQWPDGVLTDWSGTVNTAQQAVYSQFQT